MPLKLVALTFFLSMLVTKDVAQIVIVPMSLALDIERRDILVIIEALAANAGSAITPWVQTLSKTLDETRAIEPLRAGYGQGAFVVVKANRSQQDD